MNNLVYFSATDTTKRVVEAIAEDLGGDVRSYNITRRESGDIVIDSPADVLILGVPVYAGRVPAVAAGRLKRLHGSGQPAIAVCVYGNRDYDDALAELCDIAEAQGFTLVAAGAFIAEHCIFPDVAASRPDSADMAKIKEFAALCLSRLRGDSVFRKADVPGNRPYLKPGGVPLHPSADKDLCVGCGTCASECPTGAIDPADPRKTDNSKCITCCRCVHVCPQKARSISGAIYKIAKWKFVKDNSRRREPEWF